MTVSIRFDKSDGVGIVEFVQINIGWVVLLDTEENQTFPVNFSLGLQNIKNLLDGINLLMIFFV